MAQISVVILRDCALRECFHSRIRRRGLEGCEKERHEQGLQRGDTHSGKRPHVLSERKDDADMRDGERDVAMVFAMFF